MPKKKSWKEKKRERQIKQQRAQEAYRVRRERELERRARQWPKGKIVFGVCLVAVIFTAYGVWQYYIQLPPAIGGETGSNPSPTESAPIFSLRDINGTHFSLDQHSGEVITIHFMAVGCHGQYYPINDHQLKQLKTVCTIYCGSKPITAITVVASTCPSSDLAKIRAIYGVTWVLGNDFDDGKLEIIDAYTAYKIYDGTIVLIDKTFSVAQVYTEAVTADTLSSKINQLLEA